MTRYPSPEECPHPDLHRPPYYRCVHCTWQGAGGSPDAVLAELDVVPAELVQSVAAFTLLADDDGTVRAVECCACGASWAIPGETEDAMRHTCMLTHRCEENCPTCHPKKARR